MQPFKLNYISSGQKYERRVHSHCNGQKNLAPSGVGVIKTQTTI